MDKFLLLLLCVFIVVWNVASGKCPAGWSLFNKRCYGYSSSKATWSSALAMCRKYGGDLAEITDSLENEFVTRLINNNRRTWIGLNDISREGTYIWVSSGNVAIFTNWVDGQPDYRSVDEDCFVILKSGKWNSSACERKINFVCEQPLIEEKRYCHQYPCLNGGTCFDLENDYFCYCGQNYYGKKCEETCRPVPGSPVRSCYALSASPTDWFWAKMLCKNGGGGLVEINSADENAFLAELKANSSEFMKAGATWIGLNDRDDENTYKWISSGEVAGFTNWTSGQPSNLSSKENCVEMLSSGMWNDLDCRQSRRYICERLVTEETRYCINDVNCHNRGTCIDYICSCEPRFAGKNCEETCLAVSNTSGKSCYGLEFEAENWFEAKNSCSMDGRYLVEINSARENTFLAGLLHTYSNKITRAWIGLSNQNIENTYTWTTSYNNVNYTNWATGEPNNPSEENCIEMYESGKWNDFSCTHEKFYICERLVYEFKHCFPDPCLNGGTCVEVDDTYTCYCRSNFSGRHCEDKIGTPICHPGLCLNGGTCVESDNDFQCFCDPKYLGRICEEFNNCDSNPCFNDGVCVDGDNTYKCHCALYSFGENCSWKCQKGMVVYAESCYVFIDRDLDWYSAQFGCNNSGGNLVEISSVTENEFVSKSIRMPQYGYWIGLRRINDTYSWASGNDLKYNNSFTPHYNCNESCVEIEPS